MVVVGPVLKVKTGYRLIGALKLNEIQDFESVHQCYKFAVANSPAATLLDKRRVETLLLSPRWQIENEHTLPVHVS